MKIELEFCSQNSQYSTECSPSTINQQKKGGGGHLNYAKLQSVVVVELGVQTGTLPGMQGSQLGEFHRDYLISAAKNH